MSTGKATDKLKLEAPTSAREREAMEYLEELYANKSAMHGTCDLQDYKDDYAGWLKSLEADLHRKAGEERVPSEAYFLVRESDNKIVGMLGIRTKLNHDLWNFGGHIGYNIRPSERRKGYNKINLYLALLVCKNRGIEAVLLDCDKENLASSKTMRALGGKMIYEYFDESMGITLQNYVIDVDESLSKNKSCFSKMIAEYPK